MVPIGEGGGVGAKIAAFNISEQLADEPALPTNAIYLDVKKTKILVNEEYDDEERMTEQVLDHYVVTDAIRILYLGEFEPKSGTGEDIG